MTPMREFIMSRPELPEDLEVSIEKLDEQGRVTYISGHFVTKKTKLKFDAIGMEGYGGPNIGATLSDETLSSLSQLGLDNVAIDELITALQRKIMEGQAHINLREEKPTDGQEKSSSRRSTA
ncbi:MAG: hypothetical protein ABSF00_06655 [Candidatus Bathyarchaeia archaeon]